MRYGSSERSYLGPRCEVSPSAPCGISPARLVVEAVKDMRVEQIARAAGRSRALDGSQQRIVLFGELLEPRVARAGDVDIQADLREQTLVGAIEQGVARRSPRCARCMARSSSTMRSRFRVRNARRRAATCVAQLRERAVVGALDRAFEREVFQRQPELDAVRPDAGAAAARRLRRDRGESPRALLR